jgi:hypothetical protein
MIDLLFVIGSMSLFFAIGQLLCQALPQATMQRCELASPVIGFGLFGISVTLLYRFGVPIGTAGTAVVLAVLVASAVLVLRRWRTLSAAGPAGWAIIVAAAVVILLCLLPKWMGGAQFWVFQGNDQDQINYIAYSSAMRARSYADLMALTPATALDNDYFLGAQKMLMARPTVCLAFAALASLSGQPTADVSYDFQVVMQVNMLFAAAFLLVNCFPARLRTCVCIAAALTLGFFLQYVFDIDAWSELASLPLVLVGMTAAIAALTTSGSWRGVACCAAVVAAATASVLYFYPDAALEFALPVLVALRGGDAARRAVAVGVVGTALALMLCLPFWQATIGYLYRISTSTIAQPVDWWVYFQKYLFGGDVDYFGELGPTASNWTIVHALLSLPVDFVAGAVGIYFVLPTDAVPLPVRAAWKLALWAGLTLLLAGAARAALIEWRRDRYSRTSLILILALAACLLPPAFMIAGKFWAAGKALSMAAPLLFIALAAPLLTNTLPHRWQAAAALYVALHIGFGVYRPIAAANPTGIHYASPYPAVADPASKTELSWDLGTWRSELRRCHGASIDISAPVLERYVQMYLSELQVPWSSVRPLNTYYGTGTELGLQPQLQSPDCVVTTRVDRTGPGQTLIWLGRNPLLMDFLHGAAEQVDLVDVSPNLIELAGMHAVEHYGGGVLRWTDGDAQLRIPNDPGRPARKLDLALWGVRLAGAHLRLQVNDVDLFDGDLADGEIELGFPLDAFTTAPALTIRVVSNSFTTPQDSRRLGLALRRLVLRR